MIFSIEMGGIRKVNFPDSTSHDSGARFRYSPCLQFTARQPFNSQELSLQVILIAKVLLDKEITNLWRHHESTWGHLYLLSSIRG